MSGNYKTISTNKKNSKEFDEYDVVALAKRVNISFEDMKNMSYVSLMNILISNAHGDDEDEIRDATQEDIDKYFG